MAFFNETVAAFSAGRSIGASLLVFMDFRDTPRRWWTGFGNLAAGGQTWLGTGEMIAVDGLESAIGTAATQTTFTLSGIDPTLVALARNASDQVKGRRVQVFIQFFQVSPTDARIEPWSNLDKPFCVWTGEMDQMSYSASGPDQRTITLTAESLWADRNRPPFGLYTDRDQNARFPGDRGLEQVASLVGKTIRWPTA